MVLGLESPEAVPHSETWEERDAWLRKRGAQMVHLPLPCKTPECLAEHLFSYLNGCPASISGRTSEGHSHVAVAMGGQLVDTVDWTVGNPLDQPDSDGVYWLTLIVPTRI